jgi:D-glycero-D-manno-heptose 1,7-bisphosphate phosphatase
MFQPAITPILWLDLDGTLRKGPEERGGRHVQGPDDVEIFEGVPSILAAYRRKGWRCVGITNQGGVALGLVDKRAVDAGIKRTNALLGSALEFTCVCYHHPDAAEIHMRECWCRKPGIGMLLDGAARLRILYGDSELYVPSRQLLVGDMDTDKACAKAANVRFAHAKEWRESTWQEFL